MQLLPTFEGGANVENQQPNAPNPFLTQMDQNYMHQNQPGFQFSRNGQEVVMMPNRTQNVQPVMGQSGYPIVPQGSSEVMWQGLNPNHGVSNMSANPANFS